MENLQVRLHSKLVGSSLAHAIQVPMGPLISTSFTSLELSHSHTHTHSLTDWHTYMLNRGKWVGEEGVNVHWHLQTKHQHLQTKDGTLHRRTYTLNKGRGGAWRSLEGPGGVGC